MPPPSKDTAKRVPGSRRRARRYALQALFQWHFNGGTAAEIERQFREANDFSLVDAAFFRFLLRGVIGEAATLDERLLPLLDRPLKDLGGVEHTLLRMGAWEICCEEDLPWKVAVDQATALARIFGATGSHGYVNAVLDRLAQELGLAPPREKASGGDVSEDVLSEPREKASGGDVPEDVLSEPREKASGGDVPEDVLSQPREKASGGDVPEDVLSPPREKASGGDVPEDVLSPPREKASGGDVPEDVLSPPREKASGGDVPEDVLSPPREKASGGGVPGNVLSQSKDAEEKSLPPLPSRPAGKAKQAKQAKQPAGEKSAAEKNSSSDD